MRVRPSPDAVFIVVGGKADGPDALQNKGRVGNSWRERR